MVGVCVLMAFALAGEGLRRVGHVLMGDAVIGLALLSVTLVLAARLSPGAACRGRTALTPASELLIRHMGLLFVPAGVGVFASSDMFVHRWAPISAGLVGSTLLATAAVCLTVKFLAPRRVSRLDG